MMQMNQQYLEQAKGCHCYPLFLYFFPGVVYFIRITTRVDGTSDIVGELEVTDFP